MAARYSPLGEDLLFSKEQSRKRWYFFFHQIARLPEALVSGRKRIYLEHFYRHWTCRADWLFEDDLGEYTRAYPTPRALLGGFHHYRAAISGSRSDLNPLNRASSMLKITSPEQIQADMNDPRQNRTSVCCCNLWINLSPANECIRPCRQHRPPLPGAFTSQRLITVYVGNTFGIECKVSFVAPESRFACLIRLQTIGLTGCRRLSGRCWRQPSFP
jgi:hypothetical protein